MTNSLGFYAAIFEQAKEIDLRTKREINVTVEAYNHSFGLMDVIHTIALLRKDEMNVIETGNSCSFYD